jgi:hypothetical protein
MTDWLLRMELRLPLFCLLSLCLLDFVYACDDEPRTAPANDGDRENRITKDHPSIQHIRQLFADAADCSNSYKCPPLDELQELVGDYRIVVEVAFDMMAEGDLRHFDREGKFAKMMVREWLVERHNTKTLTDEDKSWCMSNIKRVLANGHETFTGPLRLLAVHMGLPGAIELIEANITDKSRPLKEACAAGRLLGNYLKDFARIEGWVALGTKNGLGAAICALDRFDHRNFDVAAQELPLLRKAAKQNDLAVEIAHPLLSHVEIHGEDDRFRAVAKLLQNHSDARVRARAQQVTQ